MLQELDQDGLKVKTQLEAQAAGAPPAPRPGPTEGDLLTNEIDKVNSISNAVTEALRDIEQDTRYSQDFKQRRAEAVKATAARDLHELIAKLYGEPNDDGSGYEGGLIEGYLTATSEALATAKTSAESAFDSTSLSVAQAEIGGSLGRFRSLSALKDWYEHDASSTERRALLSVRDQVETKFRNEPGIGSFLANLDGVRDDAYNTPEFEAARQIAFDLDRAIVAAEAACYWAGEQLGLGLSTGVFAGALSRRMSELHPRARARRLDQTPLG